MGRGAAPDWAGARSPASAHAVVPAATAPPVRRGPRGTRGRVQHPCSAKTGAENCSTADAACAPCRSSKRAAKRRHGVTRPRRPAANRAGGWLAIHGGTCTRCWACLPSPHQLNDRHTAHLAARPVRRHQAFCQHLLRFTLCRRAPLAQENPAAAPACFAGWHHQAEAHPGGRQAGGEAAAAVWRWWNLSSSRRMKKTHALQACPWCTAKHCTPAADGADLRQARVAACWACCRCRLRLAPACVESCGPAARSPPCRPSPRSIT